MNQAESRIRGEESPNVPTPMSFSTEEWERNIYLTACSRKVRSQSPKSDFGVFCLYSGMSWSSLVQEGGPGEHSWSTTDLWHQKQALLLCRTFPVFKPFLSTWASLCKFSVGCSDWPSCAGHFWFDVVPRFCLQTGCFYLWSQQLYRKRIQILAWNFLMETVTHTKKD